jgi:hypothetical protein
MTLDITKIAPQIGDMVVKIKSGAQERREHLKYAQDKLCDKSLNPEALKRKIVSAHTTSWPPAVLYEGLSLLFPSPAIPADYTVLATDGSNIDVDRHHAARCYMINIGTVSIQYGTQPSADLNSEPYLFSSEPDLVIKHETNKHKEQQIEGALLDAKRAVEECRKLTAMAAALPPGENVLALMDGSLVLYGMQNYPDYVTEELLDKGFLPALNELHQLSLSRNLALASYISLPRSDDVVNALRVAICPQDPVDCDKYCQAGNSACDVVSGINDRMLFAELLSLGERSALFINPSNIMKRYGRHQVYFFYLKVEDEIARVEVPEWVALKPALLDLAHCLVLDQCRRGQGYPVALSEAHEQAVVTGADREEFWNLVEQSLEEEKMPTHNSTKSRSKRTRWV